MSQFRLKPWFHFTDEERSYVIYQAYKKRVLKSADLKDFIVTNRLLNWSTWLFPVAAIPVLSATVWPYFTEKFLYARPRGYMGAVQLLSIVGAWVAFINFNPFYFQMENKKEALLDEIENRIGLNVLDLNDILPRWMTSQEVNRKTIELYNERNSIFAGWLYPYEDSAEPLVDWDSWPKNTKPGKNTK